MPPGGARTDDPYGTLWDWRRTIGELYGAIRASDPGTGWARWRETRDGLFAGHPQSPLGAAQRDRFRGLSYHPYDPKLRFAVATRAWEQQGFSVDAGPDGTMTLAPFARTEGLQDALGGELTLYWIGGYGGGVFLPFKDASSGRETYGGGRYLLDSIKGADLGQAPDGRVILDFNFAYNPSCAYAPRWVCPLAPPENALPAAVHTGERAFA